MFDADDDEDDDEDDDDDNSDDHVDDFGDDALHAAEPLRGAFVPHPGGERADDLQHGVERGVALDQRADPREDQDPRLRLLQDTPPGNQMTLQSSVLWSREATAFTLTMYSVVIMRRSKMMMMMMMMMMMTMTMMMMMMWCCLVRAVHRCEQPAGGVRGHGPHAPGQVARGDRLQGARGDDPPPTPRYDDGDDDDDGGGDDDYVLLLDGGDDDDAATD
jgi:hypothetical protein